MRKKLRPAVVHTSGSREAIATNCREAACRIAIRRLPRSVALFLSGGLSSPSPSNPMGMVTRARCELRTLSEDVTTFARERCVAARCDVLQPVRVRPHGGALGLPIPGILVDSDMDVLVWSPMPWGASRRCRTPGFTSCCRDTEGVRDSARALPEDRRHNSEPPPAHTAPRRLVS